MNILALTRQLSACDYYRTTLPIMHMPNKEDKYEFAFKEKHILRDAHFENRDLIFFNRLPGYDMQHILQLKHRQAKRWKIVIDLDDYWELYTHHINYTEWERANVSRKLVEFMKIADAVFTTNDRLASEIVKINKNVHVFPNALPFGSHQFDADKGEVQSARVRFIYVGGKSHYRDLQTIEGVFEKSKSDSDIRTKSHFILAGYNSSEDYWIRAYNMMNQSGSLITRPQKGINEYMSLYMNAEVSIAPLETNRFNTFKSNLKTIEAGCKKMPIIASNIWPYLEDEEMNGKGLILCNNVAEWMDAIKFFINNPEKIKEYGDNLYNYVVKKYNLHVVNEKRYDTFKSMV